MKTAQELWELLHQAYDLPYGAAQIALTEQVLRHVEATGDPELRFHARLFATTAYLYGGEPVKAFPTFSWCVSDFDRNPAPYHASRVHNMLWLFKNMVSSLTKFPEVPLERTYAVLDDMERRYREGGHGLQPVYKYRYLVADHVGDTEQAEEWFAKWQTAPRNELSDCIGCDPSTLVRHLAENGKHAEAVELAEPVLAGELTCSEQPQSILSDLMVPFLRIGRLRESADAHRRSYLVERNNLADLWGVGDHIAFCARTGNESRGLEILQRHIDWLDRAPSPAAAMNFAASAALLLRRVTVLGHGDSPIRRAGRPDITAAMLGEELAGFATGLAARFDARNGTSHQSAVIAEVLAAEPFEVTVPLSPTARRAGATPAEPVTVPAGPVASPATAPAAVIPEIPAEATVAELLDLAEFLSADDQEAAAVAVVAVLDERFGEPADPEQAARLLTLRGFHLPDEEHAATVAVWKRAADLFAEAGRTGEAVSVLARAALERVRMVKAGDDDAEEVHAVALAAVQADVAHQDEHGDAGQRAGAWTRLSTMYLLLGRIDEANDAGDRADEHAVASGDLRRQAHHAMMRVRNRAEAHRHDEAGEAARQAWEFYREHGPVTLSAGAAAAFGQLADDPDEVFTALTEVIGTGLPETVLTARVHRGRALIRLERFEEAIDDFVEAVAVCAEQGRDEGGLFARQELAEAYREGGHLAEAAEVGEEALIGFQRLEMDEAADDTRFLLAAIYRDLGDNQRALDLYRELIERLADNPAGRGQIGEQAGQLLYDMDRDSEAALTFQAAADALRESGDAVGELRLLRRQLMALNYADEVPAAEELISTVAGHYAELPAELADHPGVIWGKAIFAFEVGNLLMRRGRYADTVPHLRDAPALLRGIEADDDADRVEGMLAEALLRSGAAAESEEILNGLLTRMGPASPTRQLAAELLEEARAARK
ncbi:tetratricopeptide repeat protein [Actinoplanes rectilineatus]|uniref:tetratricopeptide repeat protein n=1 Tax=Actinoplanes rectilineatus TaxID=113571 RepID=UPI0005F29BB8|nr:hypothetical protein [Actinoplanes rectilineatus]